MFGKLTLGLALGTLVSLAVPLTSPPLTGSRSEGAGITAVGPWAGDDSPPFTIEWVITNPMVGVWHYQYTFTFESNGGGGFSHWDLQVTPDCLTPTVDPGCITSPTVPVEDSGLFGIGEIDDNFWPAGGSNFWGVKFDGSGSGDSPQVSEFDSNRRPVWGSFLAKSGGGTDGIAYNNGLVSGSDLEIDYIARPNSKDSTTPPEIPEPATMGLLGAGLAGLVIVRRLKK